ncbi:MAG: tetratricopeptide repeat protein [Halioglobus sp.]
MNIFYSDDLANRRSNQECTDGNLHSIFAELPALHVDKPMSLLSHLASRLALLSILVLLGCISVSTQAWDADKRAPWVGKMLSGAKCDGGQVPFGPYDYLQRDRFPAQLEVVEEVHFTSNIEQLRSGNTTSAMGDVHYTLQTWPNHHRALNTALQFRLQHKALWRTNNVALGYPAECYLQRAMNFSPKDPVPYMLYGLLMHQMKQYNKALFAYRLAVKLQPDDLITQYNMGLTLAEMKKYGEARKVAQKVYAAGFPLPGLKRKLEKAGQWQPNGKTSVDEAKVSDVKAPENNTIDVEVSEVMAAESIEPETGISATPSSDPSNITTDAATDSVETESSELSTHLPILPKEELNKETPGGKVPEGPSP